MKNHHWSPARRIFSVLLVIAVSAGVSFAGSIKLDNTQIPPNPGALKRLKNSRSTAPTGLVQKVLANSHPNAKLESLANSDYGRSHNLKASKDIQGAVDKDAVVATVDTTKGHASVVPDIGALTPFAKPRDSKDHPKPSKDDEDLGKKAAGDLLRQGLFPSDSTRAELGDMMLLEASTFTKGDAATGGAPVFNADKSGPVLMTFPVKRMVGSIPVVGGKGSRGTIHVGKAGKVQGFSKRWQNASENDTVTETRSQGEIADLIRQQLAELATKADIEVQKVQLGYFDDDENYIQPVYQYLARVTYKQSQGAAAADDDYIAGYVPIGGTLEPIPSVNDKATGPAVPQGAPTNLPLSEMMPSEPPAALAAAAAAKDVPAGDPTIGRYVVRNDYVGWVNSANGFWNGLMTTGYAGWFTNSQYYWAYPFETGSSKNYYANAVNVAELEVHGDWWLWSTWSNCCDLGTVDDIPAPGFGASAGGVAAYFIIHSCEVVPSAADTADWHTKWWHVFGGLHSVLGYRTIMYIDDGAMYPFGQHMGWGYPLMTKWLDDVAGSPLYWFRPGQVMHGVWKPYGRPSVITVCGHENDNVFYTAGIGPAGCLSNYWYW